MRRPVDLKVAYRMISSGPVVLVSSILGGRAGITPIAWHMPISDDPPMIALEIYKGHFINKAILATGDFVVNIPSSDMADVVRKLGSVSGRACDKFKKFDLIKEPSKKIKSPRLGGSICIMECRLRKDARLLKEYDMILGDVVYAEAEEKAFTDRWHPENSGPRPMHHLGGKIFSVSAKKVLK